jgi:GNAT superfamily N-acetyltransferase
MFNFSFPRSAWERRWKMTVIDDIRFHCELDGIDWTEVDQLFREAGLGERNPEQYPDACRRSYACVFAELAGHTIGMGRLVSDGFAWSVIFDVAVRPQYQKQGIGRRIMELLHEKLPKPHCLLFFAPGKEGFYKKLGYHRCKVAMMRVGNPEKARELGMIE